MPGKRPVERLLLATAAPLLAQLLLSTPPAAADPPWREAGLTEREAAAHLLDRLTFGPRPGDVDRVVEIGLEEWLDRQLESSLPEPALGRILAPLETLGMPAEEAAEKYPNPGVLVRQMMERGTIDEADVRALMASDDGPDAQMRRMIFEQAREQGYGSQRRLIGEAMVGKLLRATYAENQLEEVLTDFWFNHFNVSITDNQARTYVPSYEHDAIRPHVLGDFREMLGATARHPAMLLYLDNSQSSAEEGVPTTMSRRLGERYGERGRRGEERRRARRRERPNASTGLNENYARELLELHTLGVDGGYTQEDIVDVARAFTGWSAVPPRMMLEMEDVPLQRALSAGVGFELEGAFLFRADAHDEGKKRILGQSFPPGRGLEEGEAVLDLVAEHPSTAEHLARKLATRFVADDPPQSVIDRLVTTYRKTGGDLERMMETLVDAPEFWSEDARHQKIKSPFELAVSALRALDATVVNPRATIDWIERMGQPLYAYQAPTGYPDRADHWVNTGSLLNRMNFGLQLAKGALPGVRHDLEALNGGREPESLLDALETYAALLMPERDLAETVTLLEPLVATPDLASQIDEVAPEIGSPLEIADTDIGGSEPAEPIFGDRTPLTQVVGVILGSPEFQRH